MWNCKIIYLFGTWLHESEKQHEANDWSTPLYMYIAMDNKFNILICTTRAQVF